METAEGRGLFKQLVSHYFRKFLQMQLEKIKFQLCISKSKFFNVSFIYCLGLCHTMLASLTSALFVPLYPVVKELKLQEERVKLVRDRLFVNGQLYTGKC